MPKSKPEKEENLKKPPANEIGYVKPREIEQEMQESYLDYAMSVIVSRALPDVRDGLKPVHRRVLYAMNELGLHPSARYRKSATVVGEVLGKYHPHGDVAVYDSLVRLAQDFAMRYPLVDGQGNFGCFTGDTKVALADGRHITFKELVKEHREGKKNYTYTFNHQVQSIEIAEIKTPRITRKNAQIVEILLDNQEKIRCTPDHLFMMRNGSYKKAQFLKENDSLIPLALRLSTRVDDPNAVGYKMVWQPFKNVWEWVHRLSDQWNLRHGLYENSDGRIRHHIDFNKLNNNPDNIKRMQWAEHWKLHYEFTSQRHKTDPAYVTKLKRGREKYWADQKNRTRNAQLLAQRSKQWWQDPKYRAKRIKAVKQLWKNSVYKQRMRLVSRKNLQELWATPEFQKLLSETKSRELKKRWQDKTYRKVMSELMRQISFRLWSDPKHKEYIRQRAKEWMNRPEIRQKYSAMSKQLWSESDYRAKFGQDHFSKMAKILWQNPEIRKLNHEKAKKQWLDPKFRAKVISVVKNNNRKRLEQNPDFMKGLAAKARVALKEKWRDANYKERIIKSKILGFVNGLIIKNGSEKITPEIYEQQRTNNGVPSLGKALAYFSSFTEIIKQAKTYNHKVTKVKFIKGTFDVYDLTIESTHNFALACGIFVHNSMDGDAAAAMRYTESRLAPISEQLLEDINKDTVNWRDNYDATKKEPTVLPARLPNLLINGTLGIAVGMATDIPPHNLREIGAATAALIDNPHLASEDLMEFVQGPDFPTGGIIYDWNAIKAAYATGKGSVVVRAKTEIVEKDGAYQIVIAEIPYRVNKATLLEKFADLVRDKKIDGIRDLRDESDKDGVRIVVDLKKDALANKVLNQLFNYTQLQDTFHLNMLALVDGIEPRVLNLKNILEHYIDHRREVVERRSRFDLERARERVHILEGLKKALDHIDAIIKTIKQSDTKEIAHRELQKKFKLSEKQATAILEMRLSALAGLERKKLEDELKEKRQLIAELEALLKSAKQIDGVVKTELAGLVEKFGDERRTKLVKSPIGEFKVEDLIANQEVIIVVTKSGYVKRLPPDTYKKQGRGGKGVIGITTKETDVVEHLISAETHDDVLFFTNKGRVFQTKVYELPEASRTAKGQALVNFLELRADEMATAVITFGPPASQARALRAGKAERQKYKYLFMGTRLGTVKKTDATAFDKVRRSGLIAMSIQKGDELKWVKLTTSHDELMMTTANGQAIRFRETDVRAMGRTASGVRGIRLKKNDEVMSLDLIEKGRDLKTTQVLVISELGLGKKTDISEYKIQKRGGSGIKTMHVTKKTGPLKVMQITSRAEEADLVVISKAGQTLRTSLGQISTLGRATQGVRIIRLDDGDSVASATIV